MENLGVFYHQKVVPAVNIIKAAKEVLGDIVLAYNGGKDCSVILEMIEHFDIDIPVVLFSEPHTFPELIHFTKQRIMKSKLRHFTLSEDIRMEMKHLAESGTKGVLLGERMTDPSKPTSYFARSSDGWGEFTRVYPIFNWSYSDVWLFLDGIGAEYCDLYRHGYTSIGKMSKTIPNPEIKGRHARELFDSFAERRGRI